MKFGAIKNLIGAVAPTLGSALGGPVGGMAAETIAKVLGCSTEPKELQQAIEQATPKQLAEIKKAEIQFQTRMKELEVDVFALETKDIQHARETMKGDWTPRFIAVVSVLFFGGYVAMITIQSPDENDMNIVNLILGWLGGMVSSIISFYFGASHKD